MRGNDSSRFCSHCRLNVFNIAEMTRPEAEELIRTKNGRLCVRYYRRADGTIATRECRSRWRRNLVVTMSLFFASVVAMFGWLIWTSKGDDRFDNWMRQTRQTEPFATVLNWIDSPVYLQMGSCLSP
jgi:hypothetical protein